MRRQIIETLAYPCTLVVANLDLDECPQNRYFNPVHPSCRTCSQGEECRWLNSNSEFTVLAEKPMEALYDALLFSIDYVDSLCSRADHNVRRCPCESCEWVRAARRLARQYGHRMA